MCYINDNFESLILVFKAINPNFGGSKPPEGVNGGMDRTLFFFIVQHNNYYVATITTLSEMIYLQAHQKFLKY